jgi:hypothetical protein
MIRRFSRWLHSFLFAPEPVYTLALLRILFGVLLVVSAVFLIPHFSDYYGPEALIDASKLYRGQFRIRLIEWAGGSREASILVFSLHLGASLAFLLGWRTRLSGWIAYLTLTSLHHQNPTILNSGDVALRITLFFLACSPAGEAWSIDSRGSDPKPKSPWALRMIQFQMAFIYLSTALHKLPGTDWRDGTAVYYASRLWDFERFLFTPLFDSLPMVKLLTWGSLALEFALGLLIWIPALRMPLILLGIGFHLGIELTMNIPWFEWVMIFMLLSFIPSERIFFLLRPRRAISAES